MKNLVIVLAILCSMTSVAQAQGDAASGASKVAVCSACHGASGNESLLPTVNVAKIGGQNQRYLLKQMQEIKSGARVVPLMAGMLNTLNDQDMADVAAYFASLAKPQGAAEPAMVDLGESLYRAGNASIGVAACSACHSPTGLGNVSAGYPAISGQDSAYLAAQLRAFRAGERQNDDAEMMRSITARLNDREISALASYISGLR